MDRKEWSTYTFSVQRCAVLACNLFSPEFSCLALILFAFSHICPINYQDTSDELQWQQLNKSLLRVSSTVNGKRHAIPEIEV